MLGKLLYSIVCARPVAFCVLEEGVNLQRFATAKLRQQHIARGVPEVCSNVQKRVGRVLQ